MKDTQSTKKQEIKSPRVNVRKKALISECQRYRYWLSRIWKAKKPKVMFIMLNPSTADDVRDDPTIRRCIQFARNWGYGGLYVCNLYAYRTPSPLALRLAEKNNNIIGPECKYWIDEIVEKCDGKIIFAWGDQADAKRAKTIAKMFPNAYCLGHTKSGNPKHPLYLPKETVPIKYAAVRHK